MELLTYFAMGKVRLRVQTVPALDPVTHWEHTAYSVILQDGGELKFASGWTLRDAIEAFCVRSSRKDQFIMSDELVLVQNLIHEIRGKRVMLDSDLAKLYGVETRALKQAVRRNIGRFPVDFMFELTIEEGNALYSRSQFVTLKESGRGLNTKYKPFAFTEQGVAMLSSVLHSETAIQANIRIMRAFVQVREYLLAASSVSAELRELRARVDLLQIQQEENLGAINDLSEDVRRDIDSLYIAIGQLAEKLEEKKSSPTPRIGFKQASGNTD